MKKALLLMLLIMIIGGCGAQQAPLEEAPEPTDDQIQSEREDHSETDHNKSEEPEVSDPLDNDPEVQQPAEQEIRKLYRINPNNSKVEAIEEDAEAKVVLITIDDAPDKHALEMAYKLHELEVPAIFFVNGHFLDSPEEEQMLMEIHELGFSIGNHTFSHPNLSHISEQEQYEEIVRLSDRVEEIIGIRPVFFRAPHGVNTDYSRQLVQEQGMVSMNWSYGYDWEAQYREADALTEIMLNTPFLSNGANLLMHDRAWTNEALEGIVTGLRGLGYGFVDPETIQIEIPMPEDSVSAQ